MTNPGGVPPTLRLRPSDPSTQPHLPADGDQNPSSANPIGSVLRILLPIAALGLVLARSVWGQDGNVPSDVTPQPLPAAEGNEPVPNPDRIAQPIAAADEETQTPDLPPGVQPPRPVPEIMTMVKELPYDRPSGAELNQYRKDRLAGRITDRATFDKVVKSKVYRMADRRDRDDVQKRADDILGDVRSSSGQFRDELIKKLIALLPDLFDNQLVVRFNAMEVLANLQDERAVPILAKEIQNPNQHPAVKHSAVLGIERAPTMTIVSNRDLALRALVDLLNGDEWIHGWTRAAAARALGKFRQPRIGFIGQNAEVVEALRKLVTDPEGAKSYPNQCYSSQAARALGMLELNAPNLNVDFGRIAVEIANLSTRMGEGYLKDAEAAAKVDAFTDANWKVHFQDLYKAFHGEPQLEGSGLLKMAVGQQQDTVKQAADLVTELYQMVGHGDADETIREQIARIEQWVSANASAAGASASEARIEQTASRRRSP